MSLWEPAVGGRSVLRKVQVCGGVVQIALLAAMVVAMPAAARQDDPPVEDPATDDEILPLEDGLSDELSADLETSDIEEILRGDEEFFGTEGGYAYDAAGRRDPFASLLTVADRPRIGGPRPEGVPGMLIDEIVLTGIMRTPSGFVAQVQAARNQKSFLIREGDQLFDGEVVAINKGEVVFKQIVQDPTAIKPFRERVKALDPPS